MNMSHPFGIRMRRLGAAASLLAASFIAGGALVASAVQAAVPNPTVIGPIPVGAPPGSPSHDYPWMATMHNLAAVGWVEEEFFFEGTASRYNTGVPIGSNGSMISSGHSYKTRMIVRRPSSPAAFNGTVIVEWQNVTVGYDLDAMWSASHEHFIRSGYAWVGVSAQRVGVQGTPNALKNWSPTRYGTLDVTQGGSIVDDALSYDIFAQAMQAIRQPAGVRPLGDLAVQRVLAIGASQSATRLRTFINALHPLIGDPVDAYLLYVGGGIVRTDLPVPIFKLVSETDVYLGFAPRQADTPLFRMWEVAGAGHAFRRTVLNSRPLLLRDGVAPSVGACTNPPYPRVPIHYVVNSVYEHMVHWATAGAQPPIAPRIATSGATIQRDAYGNALGGIRLAEFAVPTALNSGVNGGPALCNLYGTYLPFAPNVVNQLYPTHGSYVAPVMAQVDETLAAGYILGADAERSRHLAAQSIIGGGDACSAACLAAKDLVEATYFYLYTSGQENEYAAKVLDVIRTVARAEAGGGNAQVAAYAAARTELDRYIAGVRALQTGGKVSKVSADELVNGANAVLALLP